MKSFIAAAIIGAILMLSGVFLKDKKSAISLATFLFAALFGITIWEVCTIEEGVYTPIFNNMFIIGRDGAWFTMLLSGCTLLYILLMGKDFAKVGAHVAEYFSLIAFILFGAFLLTGYNNLLILFLGIEILSIPQYVLAGADKRNLKSSEGSLKYFIMGAFTTGIILMGIALLYGASGTFEINKVEFLHSMASNPLGYVGILFLMVGFAFKVSAAPMHIWTPDVYDGAPTVFTAFMATIVKAAAFYAFIRIFHNAFGKINTDWVLLLAIMTAATLLIGNITAVFQQSVKRMLAYSSIAQAGFMLFTVLANNDLSSKGIMVYAVAYSVATIGLFSILIKMKDYTYDGFNGLAKKQPFLAFAATIFLLSLTGVPLTAGFMAKYFVLQGAVLQGGLLWLVIFALVFAAVSAYYYFRLIQAMYFKEGDAEMEYEATSLDKLWIGVACVIVILIGIAPHLILKA